jgi:F0F1-type ATP synthase delta subunit
MEPKKQLMLPVSVASPTDIARLLRESEQLDDFFRQSEIRQSGEPSVAIPQISKLMDQLIATNQLNVLQKNDRQLILETLLKMNETAPVLHISFSVDPPGSHIQKIVSWLRTHIDPHVLVTIGLQPNIGAGCVVRTTNKLFDMSLREFFTNKRQFFVEKLHIAIADPSVLAAEQAGTVPEGAQQEVQVGVTS